jgi:hypothetical protein
VGVCVCVVGVCSVLWECLCVCVSCVRDLLYVDISI